MNFHKPRDPGRLKSPFLVMILLMGVLFIAAGPPDLPAQESGQSVRLTPDEAVDLAIKNNLSLESARVTSSTKKRASDLSWNQFIPNVTATGNLLRDNEQSSVSATQPVPGTGIPTSAGGISGIFNPQFFVTDPIDVPQWHLAGSIQASLTISLAMFENMKRLRLEYEGGLVSYEKARVQLERDVRKSYNNILLLGENIDLLRESFENAGRQVQMAQANYNAGLAPELTLLQARVAMENLKPAIDNAENDLKLSMAQFAMHLGLPYDTSFELTPPADISGVQNAIPLDLAELISKAASGKPDIQELRQNILVLQSARKAQIMSLAPFLNFNWNYNSAFIKDPWKDPWFDSKDNWQKSGSLTLSLGLRLHSLIPFSQDFQGISNLNDQVKTASIGLAQMIRGTEIEIYNTVLSLEKTRTSAEAQAQTVNLAERSYRLTEEAYRAGLQDLFQVQSAELSLRQARVQMLEQQFNYLNGLIDLEYSIGVPFGTMSNVKGSE